TSERAGKSKTSSNVRASGTGKWIIGFWKINFYCRERVDIKQMQPRSRLVRHFLVSDEDDSLSIPSRSWPKSNLSTSAKCPPCVLGASILPDDFVHVFADVRRRLLFSRNFI